MTDEPNECLYKILVVGDPAVGKTSIIKRYVHKMFSPHYKSTIGLDFALKILNVDENNVFKLQFWDIGGQERFGQMTSLYYREAVAALVVFDITRQATFSAVQKWKADIDSKVCLPNDEPIPVILLANKSDLVKQNLDKSRMDAFCKEHNFQGWFATSARDDVGINEACSFLVEKIRENDKQSDTIDDATVVVPNLNDTAGGGCAC
ncbi:hypothetical protein P9112_004887 [Eukaryota sp. TZLM1-RC]